MHSPSASCLPGADSRYPIHSSFQEPDLHDSQTSLSQDNDSLSQVEATIDDLFGGVPEEESDLPYAFCSQKEELLPLESQQGGLLPSKSLQKLAPLLSSPSGQVQLLRSILTVYVELDRRPEIQQKADPWKTRKTRFVVLYHSATSSLPEAHC